MANRNIENIARNWFAMSEEEQELKIAEWLYRSNIPTLAQELINRIYENDDDDDDDSSDNSGMEFDSDTDGDDNADSDENDYDNADHEFDDNNNADDESDADSDSTLQEDMDVDVEEELFDFFKFDYSYDRHNGPPYTEEIFNYAEEYGEAGMVYDEQAEQEYEEFIDR